MNWRFLENVLEHQEGLLLRCRPHISLENDLYLQGHQIGGVCLIPMVIMMEACAEVSLALVGDKLPIRNLSQVKALAPIPIPKGEPTEIEIDCRVSNRDLGEIQVNCQVRLVTSEGLSPRFKTSVHFGLKESGAVSSIPELEKNPLPLNPRLHYYGKSLFVTGDYQLIQTIYSVEQTRSVCQLSASSSHSKVFSKAHHPLALANPFRRHCLQQAAILSRPDLLAVPVSYDTATMYKTSTEKPVEIITSRVSDVSGGFLKADCEGRSRDGELIESVYGISLKVLSLHPEWSLK